MKLPEVHFYKLTTVRTILFHLGSYFDKKQAQIVILMPSAIETKKIFFIFDK